MKFFSKINLERHPRRWLVLILLGALLWSWVTMFSFRAAMQNCPVFGNEDVPPKKLAHYIRRDKRELSVHYTIQWGAIASLGGAVIVFCRSPLSKSVGRAGRIGLMPFVFIPPLVGWIAPMYFVFVILFPTALLFTYIIAGATGRLRKGDWLVPPILLPLFVYTWAFCEEWWKVFGD